MKKRKYKIINKKRFYTFISICIVTLAIAIALFFNIKTSFSSYNEGISKEYIVRNNDTVWKVAENFNSNNVDIRTFVDLIIEENHISNSKLIPGEKIKIPAL